MRNQTLACCLGVALLAFPAVHPGPLAADAVDSDTPAVPVTVSEVRAEAVAPMIPAAGTVYSRNEAQITAGLAARLSWIAEPGARIAAGEPVARFDCDLLELRREEQLAQAERERINFESLGREVERLERATLATSVLQLERVRAARDLAAADIRVIDVRIRQTAKELERCVATAPFSGVVTERLRRPGEDVSRGEVLAAMTDTRRLEVRAAVPIRYLPRIQTGRTGGVRLNELRFEGLIRTAVPAANAQSQTFEVRIDLPAAAPDHLAAGQLVSVTLPLSANDALTVPRDSIVLRADGAHVMRIDGVTARRVAIEVAEANGERVAVRGDLKAGDRIAVRGAEALEDGRLVAIHSDS